MSRLLGPIGILLTVVTAMTAVAADPPRIGPLTLARDGHWLAVRGPGVPGEGIRVLYLETYCRAGSTKADWGDTAMTYESETLEVAADGRRLRLRDTVVDGLVVDHEIIAGEDEVEFRLEARNPTARRSQAHWAQACVQLAGFTGHDPNGPDIQDYLPKCFVFLDGRLERLPTRDWATQARYTPGQVWRPAHVPESDVNPRPLNARRPGNGLIGCFSKDEKLVCATAWEPYQELFQGVIRCLHSDFRLGGLEPGEKRRIRGKIYVVPADIPALLQRYERDFPEHARQAD